MQDNTNSVFEVENGIRISTLSGGVYETTKAEVEPESLSTNTTGAGRPWARWGKDNNYPQRIIDAMMADPSAALLETKRALHWGDGLFFYTRRVEKGIEYKDPIDNEYPNAEIEDFFFENDIDNTQQGIIGDYEWWNCYPIQYITNTFGKILQMKWHRMKDIRSELRNLESGKIDNYYLSGHWPNPPAGYYSKIAAYERMGNRSGIYKHQLVSIDKDYNPQPAWHGITKWLYVASKIPRWILANIDNSMNIKYHVEIPLAYFLQRHPEERYKTTEEWNKAMKEDEDTTYKNMDAYLAGVENVHKAFYSKVAIDDRGNVLPGWKITVLDNKTQDEAWLKAYGTASMANISGIGLSPSIAGSILPNGLGSGSGSDLREQFNFHMQVKTSQPRQTTLEWYKLVRRKNGWPKDIHLGYRNVVLQSTDQNKSGFEKPSQTSSSANKEKEQP